MKCPKCGRQVEANWNFCKYCRYDLRTKPESNLQTTSSLENIICPKCGTSNASKNKFCMHCGSKLFELKKPKTEKEIIEKTDWEKVPQTTETPATTIEEPEVPMSTYQDNPISDVPPPASTSSKTITPEPHISPPIEPLNEEIEEIEENVHEDNEEFEFINWIKNHGLRTITEIKEHIHDNCDMLNTYLFNILSEIREYSEWTLPDPVNDKKFLIKYGKAIEDYALSIDCKKLDDKHRCKSIIQTFINSLNEAITQLVSLI
ncbi:MAG: zinc-ribbon domain-containing protein [Candidatus Helarchaeota archaeon]